MPCRFFFGSADMDYPPKDLTSYVYSIHRPGAKQTEKPAGGKRGRLGAIIRVIPSLRSCRGPFTGLGESADLSAETLAEAAGGQE